MALTYHIVLKTKKASLELPFSISIYRFYVINRFVPLNSKKIVFLGAPRVKKVACKAEYTNRLSFSRKMYDSNVYEKLNEKRPYHLNNIIHGRYDIYLTVRATFYEQLAWILLNLNRNK
jgi:hypothetical protein